MKTMGGRFFANFKAYPSEDKSNDQWTTKFASLFATSQTDMLALDLNGDGVQTTALADSSVYFDLHGTGYAAKTVWVESHDGFLVRDVC
ncbi:MAG: hypothetical protein PHW76_08320 [Alphaproteobacteria bacterium]|nr:hypothetical protein [Alphaproteobacteria bacterium]